MTSKLKALARAIKRLDDTADRPQARRNGRRRVLSALRAVRAQVDREFPVLAVAKRQQKKGIRALGSNQHNSLDRVMRGRGWVNVGRDAAVGWLAAGVRLRSVRGHVYAPSWAVAIGAENPGQIRTAKKSVKARRAALAAAALLQSEPSE